MKTSEKIYREDSYLTSMEAEVVSCIQKGDYYEVILDKTIFYPHMSGGQPKDKGTINGIEVFDVQEQGEEIIHMLHEPLNGRVSLSIDYETRFDYMQQHSGQHILSYSFAKLCDGKTVGFHLSDTYTTIDIDKVLTEDMIVEAELLSNKIIYENKPITADIYNYEETQKLNLRKLPPELDNLRIISVEGYDSVACGGTHVKNTGEVGMIKVVKTEKYKAGTRVEFLCGNRGLNDYINKNHELTKLSSMLTCRTDMLLDNIEKLLAENKMIKKDYNILANELNEYKAEELKNNAAIKDNIKFIFAKYNSDIKDLRYICSKITEDENYVSILVSEKDNTCNLVMGQSKNLKLDLKEVFEKCKGIINAKGGGNNYLLQGQGTALKGEECIESAKSILFN
ncbi:DHHA1 domain-containing protein [Sedimentibacter sp.]|uniref:alanyl-tRNA editing protein n=1 Tax=Sedimentibacter sp. TaxID=1960295 RepID=UPI0028AD2FB5|nr:DHHA1 domain-containing protein [Sedimentibacter sp.]